MKKIILVLSSLLASAFVFSSCDQDKNMSSEQPVVEQKTYTLTIGASKSNLTKALQLDGNTLNAVWGAGEVVKVYARSNQVGTLSPLTTGSASAVLSGTVSLPGDFRTNDEYIDLVFGGDLSGQDGSLANIRDWAKAWFQVERIEGSVIVPKGDVVFNNWTSIVRFNIKKGGSDLNVSQMVIRTTTGEPAGSTDKKITVTPTPAASTLYVSLANYSGDDPIADTFEILVTDASDGAIYSCIATGKTFLRGSFYDITLNVSRPTFTVAGSSTKAFKTAWAPTLSDNDLDYNDGTGLYSKSFDVNQETVEFKVVRNHSWDSGAWPTDKNYSFVFPRTGRLDITFNPSTNVVTATGSLRDHAYTVAGTSSQAGIFATDWAPSDTNYDMTLTSDGSLYKVLSGVNSGTTITFKVCEDNSWTTSWGYRSEKTNCAGDSDGNCIWTATKKCDVKIWINPGNDNYIYVEEI